MEETASTPTSIILPRYSQEDDLKISLPTNLIFDRLAQLAKDTKPLKKELTTLRDLFWFATG